MKKFLKVATVLLCMAHYASGADTSSWAFNTPVANGYSIALNSVEPAPGTPLAIYDRLA